MQSYHNQSITAMRPKSDSQAGRILLLLESAKGGRVSLLEILALRIAQYSARIHELRHRFGFIIENGGEDGHSERRWFRLVGKRVPLLTVSTTATPPVSSTLFPCEQRHLDLG